MYFTKDHELVRRAVRDFVNKEINPYVDEWEEAGIAPLHEIFKKMGENLKISNIYLKILNIYLDKMKIYAIILNRIIENV